MNPGDGVDPTVGRIVYYTIAPWDNIQNNGNPAHPGAVYPAIVVREWGARSVNLQVFLDGPETYWATSRMQGDPGEPGTWHWPPRV